MADNTLNSIMDQLKDFPAEDIVKALPREVKDLAFAEKSSDYWIIGVVRNPLAPVDFRDWLKRRRGSGRGIDKWSSANQLFIQLRDDKKFPEVSEYLGRPLEYYDAIKDRLTVICSRRHISPLNLYYQDLDHEWRWYMWDHWYEQYNGPRPASEPDY